MATAAVVPDQADDLGFRPASPVQSDDLGFRPAKAAPAPVATDAPPAARAEEQDNQPPTDNVARPYQPTEMDQLRGTIANSAIGHALEEGLPKVADALNLHPSETVNSPTYQSDREQLLAPQYAARGAGKQSPDLKPSGFSDIATGVGEAAGGLTSPSSMAMLAVPVGEVAGLLGETGMKLVPRLVSGGFSAQMLYGLAKKYAPFREAMRNGDYATARQLAGQALVEAPMALATAAHALHGEAAPVAETAKPEEDDFGFRPAADTTRTFTAAANAAKPTAKFDTGGFDFDAFDAAHKDAGSKTPSTRPVIQGSNDADAIRTSATQQEPMFKATVQGAVSGVEGAEVVGSRVKDADSQANKADRDKPVETQKDHLGVRIAVESPEAGKAVEQSIEKTLPVVGKEPLDNNGLVGQQIFVQTGKPGEANQVSEIQILPKDQVKVLAQTDELYDQQKKALAAGDKEKADALSKQITEIHKAALTGDKPAENLPATENNSQEKGDSGQSPEPNAGALTKAPTMEEYQKAQDAIDKREDELEKSGENVLRMFHARQPGNEVLKGVDEWKPMPSDLEDLYDKRDEIGSKLLKTSVDEITKRLEGTGIKGKEASRVLDYYALNPERTDAASQYMAAQHAQKAAAEPIQRQLREMYIRLAGARGIDIGTSDLRADIYRDKKTRDDAANAVKAVVGYFKGEEPTATEPPPISPFSTSNDVPKLEAGKITKGASVTLSDGTNGTVAWTMGGKARIKTEDGARRDVPLKDVKLREVKGVTEGTPEQPQPVHGAIAVDLDKTLAEYDGYKGPTEIGKPIASEVERVKQLIDEGKDVWIYSARAADPAAVPAMKAWTKEHFGKELPITNIKYPQFDRFIDDRAEQPIAMQEASNAVREQSPAGILQRQPEETGGAGGERGRVEPGEQGREEPSAAREQQQAEPAGSAQPVEGKTKEVVLGRTNEENEEAAGGVREPAKAEAGASGAGEASTEEAATGSAPSGDSTGEGVGNLQPGSVDSEASGQGGLFGEQRVEPDEETTKAASKLGSTFYSGFADPELFKRLFPDVASRIEGWLADEVTPGHEQRAMMRQTRGEMDRRIAVAMQKLSAASREWRTRSREDSMAFWNAVEQGKVDGLDAKDQALANLFKGAFDQMRGEIQQLKPEALQNYIENYFPHLWEKESSVSSSIKGLLTGKRPFAGKGSFLKKRTIPTMQDGIDLGFKPKTWNPVESFLMKYSEMAHFLMGHQTLQMMKDAGSAKFVRIGDQHPEGWTQLDDRIGTVYGKEENAEGKAFTIIRGHYYAPADAAKVFNNFVSRGVAGRSGIYDSLNWINQNLNALQLGVSAFHAATTTINGATSDVALGIQQLAEGKPLEAGASMLKGASIVPSMVSTIRNGSKLLQEYLTPGSYEKFSAEANALAEAGGRVRQNTLEIKPLDQVISAWRNGAVKEGLTKLPAAILEATVRPVMEYYVPRMKVGAFYSMAHDILEQAAKSGESPEKTRAKMQRAWDSIDNRFGQVVYDNFFWHKGLRDALQLSQRSVGWNFGDIRELGGGAIDAVKQAGRAASGEMPEVTPRMAFAIALPMVSAMIGGVLTYLWTGKKPDTWKDYFYPKTADGTRHSIPGYMKDVFSFAHAPVDTALNKLAPIWSLTADAVNNRDFYGTEIRHKDDPMMKQLGEFSSWAAKQAIPFSFSGAGKLLEKGGAEPTLAGMMRSAPKHMGDVALGQLGFNPAPASIQNSEAMNAAHEYARENRPPGTRTEDQANHQKAFAAVIKMYRSGRVDHDQIERYQKEGKLPGNSVARAAMESRYPAIVVATRGLDIEQLLNVYDKGTPQEKDALRPVVARKYKSIEDISDPDRKQTVEAAYERAINEGRNEIASR